MRTAVEYLTLSERYRIAKLGTHDVATKDQLEIFERSYFLLAQSAQVLARSNALKKALERRDERDE
jgi:hypothetical protein